MKAISQSREDFTCLQGNEPLIYLDTAATALTPNPVIEAITHAYQNLPGNVHRGVHAVSENVTNAYESARATVASFIHANASEIVFVKNTTEGINLVAHSYAAHNLKAGDTILISLLEHHSNSVPWLQLQERIGINIEWIPITEAGEIDMIAYAKLLSDHPVKLVAVTGQSNTVGVKPNIKKMTALAHQVGAVLLVDAAQLVVHSPVDVTEMDCDFLVCSGHKLYGPTGIGVLYIKPDLVNKMQPFMGGGGMIKTVEQNMFTAADAPYCFEAGTPPITQVIGLEAAVHWLQQWSWHNIEAHEKELSAYARNALQNLPGVQLLAPAGDLTAAPISFTIVGVHPHDVTDLLGQKNIALRAGHHCTQPLHKHWGIAASTRMSFGIYNTTAEIDDCIQSIIEVQATFK